MKSVKKYLGIVWMILSILLVGFMLYQAVDKVGMAPAGALKTNTMLQWIIILLVFIPICVGLFIFGKYALGGEYDRAVSYTHLDVYKRQTLNKTKQRFSGIIFSDQIPPRQSFKYNGVQLDFSRKLLAYDFICRGSKIRHIINSNAY